jgi:hypothetical protein
VYFVSIYENRKMNPTEIVLKRDEGKEGEQWREQIQLRYILNTYVNITMYSPLQLLYAKKIIKKIN